MNLYALLIGIEHYEPNSFCSSLQGAVADVEAMAEFLGRHGVSDERILELVSPSPDSDRPAPSLASRPTYENMVAAFQQLIREAEPGAQILIFYSGHGGQTRTLIPGSKGRRGLDEGLVPVNVADPNARYLRDVEVSFLVRQMVDKGLVVTQIFDACHSAGLTRGRLTPRGCRGFDETPRPLDSLVASRKELEASWRQSQNRTYLTPRGVSDDPRAANGWVSDSHGSVMLAACRSFESAYEYPFEEGPRGVLTYCLLELLARGGSELSFQQVYDRLVSRMHRYAPNQTPVFEGDASRKIFGGRLQNLLRGVNVREVDIDRHRVILDVGAAFGVREGALFRLHRQAVAGELGDGPIVRIEESGAVTARGVLLVEGAEAPEVEVGDQAVLIDPGESFRRQVAMMVPKPERSREASDPLAAVRQSLRDRSTRFLELDKEGDSPELQVIVDPKGRYEIRHDDGEVVADLPSLPAAEKGAPERIAERLEHLCRFFNVHKLENEDQTSKLSDKLTLEIGLLPRGFKQGDELDLQPFETVGSIPRVEEGRWICLEISNESAQPLHIYVLDLQPGWSIEQTYPLNGLETLTGESTVRLPFEVYLPRPFENRLEVLKVFATADPADFRWLELPPIDQLPRTPRSALETPDGPLERLFAEIGRDGPATRQPRTQYASRFWTSSQIEFEVQDRCRIEELGSSSQ